MLTEELKKSLEEYIGLNYVEEKKRPELVLDDNDIIKGSGAVFSKKESAACTDI